MEEEDEYEEFSAHIICEDPRYPTLCINGKFNYGLDFCTKTGKVGRKRQCICAARYDNECICDLEEY